MPNPNDCQQLSELLTGYLDGELTQQDSQRVSLHIQQCEACKNAYEELKVMQNLVKQSKYQTMDDSQVENVINDLTSNPSPSRYSSILMLVLFIALFLFGYELWVDTSLSEFEQFTFSTLILVLIVWLITILKRRLRARKKDKYKGVRL